MLPTSDFQVMYETKNYLSNRQKLSGQAEL